MTPCLLEHSVDLCNRFSINPESPKSASKRSRNKDRATGSKPIGILITDYDRISQDIAVEAVSHLDALLAQAAEGVIELALAAAVGVDLAGVAADDDGVKLLQDLVA